MVEAIVMALVLFSPAFVAIARLFSRYRNLGMTRDELRVWLILIAFLPILGTIIYLLTDVSQTRQKRKLTA